MMKYIILILVLWLMSVQLVHARSVLQKEGLHLEQVPKSTQSHISGDHATLSPEVAYARVISQAVVQFQQYPKQALAERQQGTVVVRFRIDRYGNLIYVANVQRTPYPMLNKAALDAVNRASPLPPVPANYPNKSEFLEFMVPVRFVLEDGNRIY